MELLLTIWPTMRAIANETGVPYPTVTSWNTPGRRVPPAKFDVIIRAAAARGADLTYDQLYAENAKCSEAAA
ncbi:hypothetical protein [Yoonia sp. 208BN28-4]|uniref:hypothetical protein n=1 Tax=Yoonia sp. 208BN28-4 TaxID=3126505 RepID=UPI0030990880